MMAGKVYVRPEERTKERKTNGKRTDNVTVEFGETGTATDQKEMIQDRGDRCWRKANENGGGLKSFRVVRRPLKCYDEYENWISSIFLRRRFRLFIKRIYSRGK